MRSLQVHKDDTIVVYDLNDTFSAPRAHWMLSLFGARDVRLLDGGFAKWAKEGKPVAKEHAEDAFRHERTGPLDGLIDSDCFKYRLNEDFVVDKDDIEL